MVRWRYALHAGGAEALKAKPASGRPPKLNTKQKATLVKLLAQGAMAHGYRTELWTTQRIATLIERRLAVTYQRNHVGKLLHQLEGGATRNRNGVPSNATRQPFPYGVQGVACSKNAARLAAHIVFIDESGFLLIPAVRKTWSPVGQTPVVRLCE